MNCPNCQVTLAMTDRDGVEIDYCPKCRGVWLDRGELDKIIERVSSRMEPDTAPVLEREYNKYRQYDDHERPKYRKRKSFLGEIFDFD